MFWLKKYRWKQQFDKYYLDNASSKQMVNKWFVNFKRGGTNTDDAEHPNSVIVPLNIRNVHKIVLADH